MGIFITPRIAPISPSDLRHPFHIGRTLADAWQLIARHWLALLSAFACLRMAPRVLMGEDMDAGWFGDNQSLFYNLLIPLGADWGDFVARQIMDLPDIFFLAAAVAILLRAPHRPKWFGFGRALLIGLLVAVCTMALEAGPLLALMPPTWLYVIVLLLLVILAIFLSLSDVAAADESRGVISALLRSTQLASRGFFRLLVLFAIVAGLYGLSTVAEELMLSAIPVIDATLLDWATTVLQDCISGFYLPLQAAIFVSAFLHLRRHVDGDKPQDMAAIFD